MFLIFRSFENSPRISRKVIAHEFYQKHFPELYNFPMFSDTVLVNVCIQFCLAPESMGQDGAILPGDQPISCKKALQERKQPLIK